MMTAPQLNEFVTKYGDNRFDRPKQRIPEFLETVDACSWARSPEKQMSVAGAVAAFIQLYPVDQGAWNRKYPLVFEMAFRVIREHMTNPDHPAWTALHLARWFILRDPLEVDQILKLAARGGACGQAATTVLEHVSATNPEFAAAVKLLRAGSELTVTLQ